MTKEISIAGVYLAPFAVHLAVSGLAYLPVRWGFNRAHIERVVWHRPLFELAVYLILLRATFAFF